MPIKKELVGLWFCSRYNASSLTSDGVIMFTTGLSCAYSLEYFRLDRPFSSAGGASSLIYYDFGASRTS